ncbi:3-dehydroquinate dehydratase [bacterium HR29]|nr:3-dehydroquinate dehydratase [bacterium HR29]
MTQTERPRVILLVNGPNLNLLGERNPRVYGRSTLLDAEAVAAARANARGAALLSFQSNHEGALIDFLHQQRRSASGLVINPGGLTHTSVALRDAIEACGLPAVEVHVSNTHRRESFRHASLTAAVCIAHVAGFGVEGYGLAVDLLLDWLERRRAASAATEEGTP